MTIIGKERLSVAVTETLERIKADKVFVLTDENTSRLCLPLVAEPLKSAIEINIPAGDNNKNLQSVSHVWEALQLMGATRQSLLINLGGGMVTDLGGFAASCFKRGIRFVNIPTTLLSLVDASIGGKTGINFGQLKNEIGLFRDAEEVIITDAFLATESNQNILSGCAEMLKHDLINGFKGFQEMYSRRSSSQQSEGLAVPTLADIAESIEVKRRIVAEDPHEQGIRKSLNLGHTIGHALEAWNLKRENTVLHGYCVAWGLVAELYLSVAILDYPVDRLRIVTRIIRENYGDCPITCKAYPELLKLMHHDKKNATSQDINFTLLDHEGKIKINQSCSEELILEALDFLREG